MGRRIFQIGLHKCGTSTICAFLNVNGIKAAHYDVKLQRAIHLNVLTKQPLLQGYDDVEGFTDMGHLDIGTTIAERYFREMDTQYPGSKFILNVRDVENWMHSMVNHQNTFKESIIHYNGHNVFQKARIYRGVDWEDVVKKWVERWDTHVEAVLAHFKDRPDCLLVLDIESDKPEKLARFLGLTRTPESEKFAQLNQTTSVKYPEVHQRIKKWFEARREQHQKK